ncbi:MAG: DUF899 domain-containing protein [Pseudomonadota bacterium]|jgi:predicted dithiol-disulfide oxidoreductase (DUF899 family)|uniref:Dithiol-disulfide oxidoreductase (DUF899 family) n=1 Tax=Caballeronia sordidicola TaxID=196367 RepID=A0A242N2G7_CABSO|nr:MULTISPECIES: thioredoxin family protein [Burkholderiaceae]AMH43967.1 thioredoxin [Burkholderia sp. PAMC 26561]AMM16260.1 thioredoxin [Burkholderia sp. PAMC 28687]MDP9152917.1 DUF899 domain-containing protein [Pseudomonadota bacterium]OTP77867.1 hypothetical protein PAMC26577_07035 [Caballeronia sordidicola]
MEQHRIVSQDEWLAAQKAHLAEEKALTHARDALAEKRRALPWVKVEKRYSFDTPDGRKTLADLFNGRSQLIVYHFMLGPDWEAGCIGCSFVSDHMDGALMHVEQRDVAYVAVSRAPLGKIEAFKKRMGWHFKWVSSFGSDFNFDHHVSFTPEQRATGRIDYNFQIHETKEPGFDSDEMPGVSVFYKDEAGDVFRTFSAYGRGVEPLIGAYDLLDITPKGRDEEHGMTDWMRHHDRYDNPKHESGGCCH